MVGIFGVEVFGKGMVGGMVERSMEMGVFALMILNSRALGDIGLFVRDLVNFLVSSMNMIQQ